MSGHLGTEIPALVDGELDHAARERALGHLARCAACRAEVEDERRLKARLRGVGATGPRPADALGDRLRRLAEGAPPLPPAPQLLPASSLLAPAPLPTAPLPGARTSARGAVLGGTLLVVGLGAVLALGGPSRPPSRPPVDPTSDAFVADFASTGSRPLTGPLRTASVGAR